MSEIAQNTFKKNNIDVDVNTNLSDQEIIKIIANYDGLIVRSATTVNKNIIQAASKLKIIGRAGAGVDNIDLVEAKKNNIVVMNTPGANANATAEHTLTLMLSLIRNIPFANSTTHKGQWEKKSIKGMELSNKTIGIIGYGNVSARLINLLKGFNVKILVYSTSIKERNDIVPEITISSLDEVITNCDVLTFHCKSPKDGKPILNIESMKKMKSTAIIVNAARGNVIDENDLNTALNDNLLAGAAIDVFSKEPAKSNILFNNPKIILTPHIAASTKESQINVAKMISEQVSDYLINNKSINTV